MNKREFYIEACKNGSYRKAGWNVSCFALTREGSDDWLKDPYPYRLVARPNGYYYVDPKTKQLVHLSDSWGGEPLFLANEEVELQPGDMVNIYEPIVSTYGNMLANYLAIVHGFGGKIPFMMDRFTPKDVEKQFTHRIIDATGGEETKYDPATGVSYVVGLDHAGYGTHTLEQALAAPIYIDEYLRYGSATFSSVAYSQVFTPADTEKTLQPPPGLIAFRKSLIEKYKGQLHRREIIAELAKELLAFDTEYLKGDPSEGFLISKKSRAVVRMKMYLMYGAETGIDDRIDVTLIERSLSEGWDIEHLPELINALRAGSYNRGKQTESGGEAFKDLIRAAANLKIDIDDCGVKFGLPLNTNNKDWLIGFSAIENGAVTKIDADNVGTYLGRAIYLRSPAVCRGSGGLTSYCKVCMGDRLANNPNGVAIAVADYGSAFLSMFLAKAHAGSMNMKRLDLRRLMS